MATAKSAPKQSAKTTKTTKTTQKAEQPAQISKFGQKITRDGGRPVIIVTLGISLVASLASLGYCIYDGVSSNSIPAYISTGNNAANFVTEGSIADITNKVAPAVVSITTETRTRTFFGQDSVATAAGTGMIVTSDGYVLTNKHVISGANSISVILDDGTTYSNVTVAGTDPTNDVAILKIKDVSGLPTVTLGDSKTINAGQQVIAIGNALGQFQNTVTAGIVSGTGRSITATNESATASEDLTDLIQTDAAINAGNSGGPLVNAAGEVIGINTATSSSADGIGFAIPISSIIGLLNNIVKNNSADRAYLGIYYVAINADVAAAYNLPVSTGAYVYSPSQYTAVIADGPAAKAGIKDKDIITKINGASVGKAGSVASLLGEYAPGDKIILTVLRDGNEQDITVIVGKYPQQ